MPGGDFLDSNIILYALNPTDPRKQNSARSILDRVLADPDCIISFQVVQDVLSAGRRLPTPLVGNDALRTMRDVLFPLWRTRPTTTLYERAVAIADRYRYSFYDSLIIAAAVEGGCRRLLSEDLQHGQQIDGVTITNPFL